MFNTNESSTIPSSTISSPENTVESTTNKFNPETASTSNIESSESSSSELSYLTLNNNPQN